MLCNMACERQLERDSGCGCGLHTYLRIGMQRHVAPHPVPLRNSRKHAFAMGSFLCLDLVRDIGVPKPCMTDIDLQI